MIAKRNWRWNQTPETDELKELRSIRKLLESMRKTMALIALRSGASPENVDEATGMGAGNIRAMFPEKKREKKKNETAPASTEGTTVNI